MPELTVEELSEEDARELEELFKEVWSRALEYSEEWRRKRMLTRSQIVEEMRSGYKYFGVRIGGKIAGVYKAKVEGDTLLGEHQSVRLEFRRKGLAKAMYRQFISYAREVGCRKVRVNILPSQEPSLRLVREFGFKKVGSFEQAPGMLVDIYEREV
ncbi:MAG: hypothetical protein DRN99_02780 [Thermoproteota archaeon]|nr:MAG: hypothetical protein DRN99_02780 [Candidatus Korarchaeota archaeon]